MFFIFILCLGSCGKNHNYPDLPIIGHAITGLYNPERMYKDNTKEALSYALLFDGLGGVEIDVQLSKDGNLWLYHDNNLSSQTKHTGSIAEHSDDFLQSVNYKSIKKEKLTALQELDLDAANPNFELYIDLKDYNYQPMDSLKTANILESLKLFKTNSNFSAIRIILPDLHYINQFINEGFSEIYLDINNLSDGINKKSQYPDLKGVFIRNSNISETDIHDLKEKQLKVVIFDMRSIFSIRKAIAKKPYAIMVEEFRTALKEI